MYGSVILGIGLTDNVIGIFALEGEIGYVVLWG